MYKTSIRKIETNIAKEFDILKKNDRYPESVIVEATIKWNEIWVC